MKKVMIIFGTRPEAIKMCPLVLELKTRKHIEVVVCVTGQHEEMLNQVLDIFNVIPDYNLQIMQKEQTIFDITSNILLSIQDVLTRENPELVLVHGDTSTTFVSALSCYYLRIPIAHVEAGLRTNNIYSPYPEEFNRQAVSIISCLNFAPTQKAYDNLIKENRSPNNIFITGNTVIDALKTTVNEKFTHELLDWCEGSKLILLTAHRRENIGQPLKNIFKAVRRIVSQNKDIKVIYPIHMNPKVRSIADDYLLGNDRIKIIEPLDVLVFHNIMNRAFLILTDSGGIQEEAPSLGKPVLVMRNTTERPEGVEAGTLKLVGTDEKEIFDTVTLLLNDPKEYRKMSKAKNPYGDGFASVKISNIIEDYFNNLRNKG